MDIVLDLETLDTRPGAAILSIGAHVLQTREEFHSVIGGQPPGSISADAVRWWMTTPDARAREIAFGGTLGASAVLSEFAAWLSPLTHHPASLRLWGSEDFDTVILAEAYRRAGFDVPWPYRAPRGLRTYLEAAGVDDDAIPWLEGETEHVAVDCARHAARALAEARRILGTVPAP